MGQDGRWRIGREILPWLVGVGFILLWFWLGVSESGIKVDFNRFNRVMEERFGASRLQIAHDWERMLGRTAELAEDAKVREVYAFFQKNLRYATDEQLWGTGDYWASPVETLGRGAGDCEDWAIVMYFSLRSVGVSERKLRLIYAVLHRSSLWDNATIPHMVLGYYPDVKSEPLILGNIVSRILPASERPDLTPVFSFNSEGLFAGLNKGKASPGTLSNWRRVLERARQEGFTP